MSVHSAYAQRATPGSASETSRPSSTASAPSRSPLRRIRRASWMQRSTLISHVSGAVPNSVATRFFASSSNERRPCRFSLLSFRPFVMGRDAAMPPVSVAVVMSCFCSGIRPAARHPRRAPVEVFGVVVCRRCQTGDALRPLGCEDGSGARMAIRRGSSRFVHAMRGT